MIAHMALLLNTYTSNLLLFINKRHTAFAAVGAAAVEALRVGLAERQQQLERQSTPPPRLYGTPTEPVSTDRELEALEHVLDKLQRALDAMPSQESTPITSHAATTYGMPLMPLIHFIAWFSQFRSRVQASNARHPAAARYATH